MKTRFPRRPSTRGNILIVTLFVTLSIGIVLVACLNLVQSQNQSVARSQAWNACIPMLEAGIEEAMAHLNNRKETNLAMNGWTQSGNTYRVQRPLSDGFYSVIISNVTSTQAVVYSSGAVKLPPVVAPGGNSMYAAAGVTTDASGVQYVARTARVFVRKRPKFAKAMVAKERIEMNGNNIKTDSFDSSNPLYSTPAGLYDPAKARDRGDVSTISGLRDVLGIGNANIKGKLRTGAGGSAVIGPNGVVGSLAWHAAGRRGLQPGWFSDDMNIDFPDVGKPFYGPGATPRSDVVNGTNYVYVLGTDNYELPSLTLAAKQKVAVTGRAVLYVSGDVTIAGGIDLIPPGTLELYVAGANTSIGGSGVNNYGRATNFSYYGLPSNKRISMPSNGDFTGTIYAPSADFALSGGGTTDQHFSGAVMARTISVNGHYTFHYDESLGAFGPPQNFVIVSWEEL